MAATDGYDEFDVPPEHSLFVVDMKNYSLVPEVKMAVVRSDLDSILSNVFTHIGLPDPQSLGDSYEGTGDGAIIVLPARHTARLVDPLLGLLHDHLLRYDKVRLASAPPLRLRVSVHVGPVPVIDRSCEAIVEACRFVDSESTRHALDVAVDNGCFMAAALSETAYRRSVRAGRTPDLTKHHFLKTMARVNGKPGFEEPGRLYTPGVSPAVVGSYLANHDSKRPASAQAPSAQVPATSGDAAGRPAGVRQKGKASGKARIVQVGRNYTTGAE
ncbi:hypothetical protein ACIREO_39350 [Streptomyces sp. NPDC102441]|uniref:hypothetical protein n=1 Tax=Streptomyces sp. NPDC102441 TaxID=3366176 RepID=UPI003815A3B1